MKHKHRNTCKVHLERNFSLIIGFYCSLIFFADRYFQLGYLPCPFTDRPMSHSSDTGVLETNLMIYITASSLMHLLDQKQCLKTQF